MTGPFKLASLPWGEATLEPVISSRTISFHYHKHHQTYVETLNTLVEKTKFADMKLEKIIQATAGSNDENEKKLFNNAAQVWNHDFYWRSLSPAKTEPSAKLASAISRDFGSTSDLIAKLAEAGAGQFGSGWAFLVPDGSSLAVISTPNRTARSRTARRRCWASTSGSTPTTSRTRTGGPTTSTPGGTSSTGQRWRRATPPSQRP